MRAATIADSLDVRVTEIAGVIDEGWDCDQRDEFTDVNCGGRTDQAAAVLGPQTKRSTRPHTSRKVGSGRKRRECRHE